MTGGNMGESYSGSGLNSVLALRGRRRATATTRVISSRPRDPRGGRARAVLHTFVLGRTRHSPWRSKNRSTGEGENMVLFGLILCCLLSTRLLLFLNRKTEKLMCCVFTCWSSRSSAHEKKNRERETKKLGRHPPSPPPQGNSRGSVLPRFVIYPLSTKAQKKERRGLP